MKKLFKNLLLSLCLLALPLQVWAATSWTQTNIRFRNNDGNEAGASWKDDVDTDISIRVTSDNVIFRIRIGVQQTGSTSAALTGRLYISKNGGAYAQASSTSTGGCKVVDSANITDDEATTQQITAGTFVAGKMDDVNGQCTATGNIAQNRVTEHEYMLQLTYSQISDGDTFDFRERNSTTALNTYTNTGTVIIEKMSNASISTLTEDFSGASIDTSKLTPFDYGDGGTVEQSNGTLNFTSTTGVGNWKGVDFTNTYDFTGSRMSIKISDVSSTLSGSGNLWFGFYPGSGIHENNLEWRITDWEGTRFLEVVCSSDIYWWDQVFSTTYDPDVHKFLSIRESGGVIYMEHSTDGLNWTNDFSDTVANLIPYSCGLSVQDLRPLMLISDTFSEVVIYKIDDLNILPSAGGATMAGIYYRQLMQGEGY